MIIRSQDKKSIINFNAVDTIRLSRCIERGVIKEHYQTDVFYDTTDTFGVLGTYSTEEKAIKVLDMIAQNYVESKKYIIRRVFEMPQDSEV
jgi:hypothetical protein